ncbi:trypsin-3-like [Drosophila pseudoobscura]|uniref:Trypsin-3-like n=1 Tax=Drosophila pseudoobscura pseudoobscura TaxID=46245 RepID=A0A6I8VAU0_DROPS|nr:trypsin-3 [Drosophila pseudoobscura]XP_015036818.2 trypsin-3 [Drosophila pseudoobscura]
MLFKLVIWLILVVCVVERNPAEANEYYTCDSLSEKCVLFHACIHAKHKGYFKICAINSICCRVPKKPKADTRSSRACLSYASNTTFCPRHLFISHSQESYRNELQYMAHIGLTNPRAWICGGTLIHSKFVLTAAHCVILERAVGTEEPGFLVRLGGHNSTDGAIYEVAEKIPHPDYKEEDGTKNDIALLKLTKTVVFNDQVKPACLPTTSGQEHAKMTVSGWGLYSSYEPNKPAPQLRKADVTQFKYAECNEENEVLQEMKICAGGENDASDSCQGDSGGPLAIWHPEWGSCLGQVFGIVSEGSFCDTKSPRTIYTRVFYYLQWIEDIVWKTREETLSAAEWK